MEKTPNNHEGLTQVDHAWLFDVDGVITDPTEKRITNPEMLNQLHQRLKNGDLVGFNTGRSINFVTEQVLAPLEAIVEDKSLLDKIIAIGEMSGVQITYENGQRIEHIDESIIVPKDIQKEVKALVDAEFSNQMFFDKTKKTMISVEMNDKGNLELFTEAQKVLHSKLGKILKKHGNSTLKVDSTTIATDVENVSVGKERGAIRFLQLAKSQGFTPANITAFGDSNSDFEMIEPLESTGKPFTFVFVGENHDKANENIVATKSHFNEGTLEYLRSN